MAALSDIDFDKLMQRARKFCAEADKVDREHGMASPANCDLNLHLRTVKQALECGVRTKDWNNICEGIVLLEQAITRVLPARKSGN